MQASLRPNYQSIQPHHAHSHHILHHHQQHQHQHHSNNNNNLHQIHHQQTHHHHPIHHNSQNASATNDANITNNDSDCLQVSQIHQDHPHIYQNYDEQVHHQQQQQQQYFDFNSTSCGHEQSSQARELSSSEATGTADLSATCTTLDPRLADPLQQHQNPVTPMSQIEPISFLASSDLNSRLETVCYPASDLAPVADATLYGCDNLSNRGDLANVGQEHFVEPQNGVAPQPADNHSYLHLYHPTVYYSAYGESCQPDSAADIIQHHNHLQEPVSLYAQQLGHQQHLVQQQVVLDDQLAVSADCFANYTNNNNNVQQQHTSANNHRETGHHQGDPTPLTVMQAHLTDPSTIISNDPAPLTLYNTISHSVGSSLTNYQESAFSSSISESASCSATSTDSSSSSSSSHDELTDRSRRFTITRDEKKARDAKIPIPYLDIVNLSIDLFNEQLAKHTLTENQLNLIRDIRRRGKNKVAAQSCRKRKMEQIYALQRELIQLSNRRHLLDCERTRLIKEHASLTEKHNQLYEAISRAPGQQ